MGTSKGFDDSKLRYEIFGSSSSCKKEHNSPVILSHGFSADFDWTNLR